MERLSERAWRYHDADGCTSYLLVGDQRAYMIDTGCGREPLMPKVRSITHLDTELLLTHAHPDHYGAAHEFERIWLCGHELDCLREMEAFFDGMGVPPLPRERLCTFRDGDVFDAGGLTLEAVGLPGHTPGSCAFGYREGGMLFTGDAVGSGEIVLMAIPFASSVSAYLTSLRRFCERVQAYGGEWYGGHSHQAGIPGTPDYHPPGLWLARDMVSLCEGLLSGVIQGTEQAEPHAPDGRALCARYGCAGMVYLNEQIK